MTDLTSTHPAELAAGELVALPGRAGDRLHVLRGRVLVTQEGVADDFDLPAGSVLELPVHGKVVAEAVAASRMEIRPLRRWWCDCYLSVFRPGNGAAGR